MGAGGSKPPALVYSEDMTNNRKTHTGNRTPLAALVVTRIDISAVETKTTPAAFDADIQKAIEDGKITFNRAARIQAGRAKLRTMLEGN